MSNELEVKAVTVLEQARAMVVNNIETYQVAAEFTIGQKALLKEIDMHHDGTIAAAHAAHKSAVAMKAKVADPVKESIRIVNSKRDIYERAEEEKRRKEEERLRAEAKKKADDDRIAAAEKAQAEGDHQKADDLINRPVVPPPVFVEPTIPKVAGESVRQEWDFRIVNPAKINRNFMIADEVAIRRVVKSLGENALPVVGGIEVFQKTIRTNRAGVSA